MKPKELELVGFTGIRSGTGKDKIVLNLDAIPADAKIVALFGPNGKGKTTIIDNLHPYRVMPSRSNTLGPGGFSYWDHLCLPECKKRLVWEHNGITYQTNLVFKISGKTNKSDCYLSQWDGVDNKWVPVQLPDGTVSDGKSSTYDDCVNEILGSPEAFFTSNFSAQKSKSVAEYSAGEFKTILASILDLKELCDISDDAAMVGKLLRFQLEGLQDEMSQARMAEANIVSTNKELSDHEIAISALVQSEERHQAILDADKQLVAQLEAKRDSQSKDVEQRKFLEVQVARLDEQHKAQQDKLAAQHVEAVQKLNVEKAQAAMDHKAKSDEIKRAVSDIERLQGILAKKTDIDNANIEIVSLKTAIAQLDTKVESSKQSIAKLQSLRNELNQAMVDDAKIVAEGKSKREILIRVEKTAELVDQVPCNKLDIQKSCPLLKEANEAKSSIQAQSAAVNSLLSTCSTNRENIKRLKEEIAVLAAIEKEIHQINDDRNKMTERVEALAKLTSLNDSLLDAIKRVPELQSAMEPMVARLTVLENALSGFDAQLKQVETGRQQSIQTALDQFNAEKKVLLDQLQKLESPVSDQEMNQAKQKVNNATEQLNNARAKTQQSRDYKVTLLAKLEAFKDVQRKAQLTVAKADRLSDEIAKFKLIEKGMGKDGLVALSIDDAGPAITAICNDLMKECFGGRFSIRIETQSETNAGNLKETFKVMVYDHHRGGEPKLLDLVSGGEEVWINVSLLRAIALYKGQCSDQKYQTLFCDESDGALDLNNKRNFFAMKRYVLDRGGYEREYFISHTPELLEIADYIIDVGSL